MSTDIFDTTDWAEWRRKGKLAFLERSAASPDGISRECSPPSGFGAMLSEDGLVDEIEPDGFFAGIYRINEKGREYVKVHSVPAEW